MMRARQSRLRHLAGWLIAASAVVGLLAIRVRDGWGGSTDRVFEGTTLFLAATAYIAHALADQMRRCASC